jgi:hypothetical protein
MDCTPSGSFSWEPGKHILTVRYHLRTSKLAFAQLTPIKTLQGQSENGKAPWEGVRERCRKEWGMFQARIAEADKAYYEMMGVPPPNVTFVH